MVGATAYADTCGMEAIHMMHSIVFETPAGFVDWLLGNPVFGDAQENAAPVMTLPYDACAVATWDVEITTTQVRGPHLI